MMLGLKYMPIPLEMHVFKGPLAVIVGWQLVPSVHSQLCHCSVTVPS